MNYLTDTELDLTDARVYQDVARRMDAARARLLSRFRESAHAWTSALSGIQSDLGQLRAKRWLNDPSSGAMLFAFNIHDYVIANDPPGSEVLGWKQEKGLDPLEAPLFDVCWCAFQGKDPYWSVADKVVDLTANADFLRGFLLGVAEQVAEAIALRGGAR